MKLSDLKIIVTGAARGMGAHFSRRLLEAGAAVAAGDIDEAGLERLAGECAELPGKLFTARLDVADADSVAGFVDRARGELGGINGLVNNAGIIRDGLLVKRKRDSGEVVVLSDEDWQAVIDVNLTGATRMAREAAAAMVTDEVEAGVVVNISSISRHGNRGQSNYVAAKAALAANTVTWNRELARYHIRVAAVAPGMVETPMTRGMNQKARDALVAAIPVRRIGVPEDIWLAVRFALECDYFAGKCLDVDGGLSMA